MWIFRYVKKLPCTAASSFSIAAMATAASIRFEELSGCPTGAHLNSQCLNERRLDIQLLPTLNGRPRLMAGSGNDSSFLDVLISFDPEDDVAMSLELFE